MSVTDLYGKYGAKQITCDNCGDGFEAEDWEEAQCVMKEAGWKSRVIEGKRQHYCPDCQEKT